MVLATTTRIVIAYDSIQVITQVKRSNPTTPITLLNGRRLKSAVAILNDVDCSQTWTVAHDMIQVTIARIIIRKNKVLVACITQKTVTSLVEKKGGVGRRLKRFLARDCFTWYRALGRDALRLLRNGE
jgi:hypothetical protein